MRRRDRQNYGYLESRPSRAEKPPATTRTLDPTRRACQDGWWWVARRLRLARAGSFAHAMEDGSSNGKLVGQAV